MLKINIIKRKIRTLINNPLIFPIKFLYKISPLLSDEDYLKLLFPLKTGYLLNFRNPKTFNEKLQWLKINYRTPVMTRMVDKFASKEYAQEIIGDEYLIKTYGVWDSFEDIDFDKLPRQFVLKTTHDQGGVIIVTSKDELDKDYARNKLTSHLKTKHYYLTREWPYKNVKPRIIAEELIISKDTSTLCDYKFFCFHGTPKIMYISHEIEGGKKSLDFFNMNFEQLDISRPSYPASRAQFDFPENWNLMIDLAGKLSQDLPHVRIDFYNVEGKVYLGEMTFFTGGGMEPFKPFEWDLELGSWINLEKLNY